MDCCCCLARRNDSRRAFTSRRALAGDPPLERARPAKRRWIDLDSAKLSIKRLWSFFSLSFFWRGVCLSVRSPFLYTGIICSSYNSYSVSTDWARSNPPFAGDGAPPLACTYSLITSSLSLSDKDTYHGPFTSCWLHYVPWWIGPTMLLCVHAKHIYKPPTQSLRQLSLLPCTPKISKKIFFPFLPHVVYTGRSSST